MRHLVIGAGVMGKRHANILTAIGDKVDLVDIEFNFDEHDFPGIDSVLICTPPATHRELINKFRNSELPLFVEKPVVTDAIPLSYPGVSMVACNWRWCSCWKGEPIFVSYPQAESFDLIHFYDLFIKHPGWINRIEVVSAKDEWTIRLCPPGFSATIRAGEPQESIAHACDMFKAQMIYWREIISGKTVSPNPISYASVLTSRLMGLLDVSKQRTQLFEIGPSK